MKDDFNFKSKAPVNRQLLNRENDNSDLNNIADRIVQKTLTRMDLAKKDGSSYPTFLIMGELHSSPAHIVTHMLVIKKFQEKGINFAIGMEYPHDTVLTEYSWFTGKNKKGLKPFVDDKLNTLNKDGRYSLKTSLLWSETRACLSHLTMRQFILDRHISTKFNDASLVNVNILDQDDYLTRKYSKIVKPNSSYINAISREGIHTRNRIIVHNALNHAKEQNTDLYIQICGTYHVAGNKEFKFKYSESLSSIFKEKSCPIVAVPFFNSLSDDDYYLNKSVGTKLSQKERILDIVSPYEYFKLQDIDKKRNISKTYYRQMA